MKEFFGIDITADKRNETMNCEVFLARKTPTPQASAMEKAIDQLQGLGKKAELPKALEILKYVFYIATIAIVAGMIRGIGNVGLVKAYENAPALFYVAGIVAALWVLLALWGRGRSRKVVSGEDYQAANHRAEYALQSCYAALGVPGDAPTVDVMGCKYRIHNGKLKLVNNGYAQYFNPELRIFVQNDALCLADAMQLYAIPLREIRALKKINKQISLASWNKEDDCEFGRYAEFNIRNNDYGGVLVKPYYALVIQHCGEEYHLHFPCYELPFFQNLVRLPISE